MAADQLTPTQQARILNAFIRRKDTQTATQAARQVLDRLVQTLYDPARPLSVPALKAAPRAYFRAAARSAKHDSAWKVLEDTLRPRLYATRTIDTGVQWLLGADLAS